MRKKSVGLIRSDQTFLLFEPFYCRLGQNNNFVFGIYDTRSIQSKTNLYAKKTLLSDRGSGRHPSSGRRLQFRRADGGHQHVVGRTDNLYRAANARGMAAEVGLFQGAEPAQYM